MQQAKQLFVSVVSLSEIERGIVKVHKADAAFAERLTLWLEDTMLLSSDHILPVTAAIARRWGRLSAELGHEGADLLIAATALGKRPNGGDAQCAAFQAERGFACESIFMIILNFTIIYPVKRTL